MVAIDEFTSQTESPSQHKLILPVDAEHTGIRMVGCLSLFLSGTILFILGAYVTRLPAFVLLLASIILASATAYGLEKFLKQRWPSGRVLDVSDEAIALRKQEQVERTIDPQQQVNVLAWNFLVKRSSRVKKGWHVVGMSLEQEGEYIPVYTFASPQEFENMPFSDHFTLLEKEDTDKREKTKSTGTMRRAGEQRRLHEAEYDRGIFGAELTLPQFIEYLEFLQKNYPKWMLS